MAPKKDQASKTRPGELDFVTHKGDKDFHRGGMLEQSPEGSKSKAKPYEGSGKKGGMRKLSDKEKDMLKKVVQEKGLNKSQAATLRMRVMRAPEVKSVKAIVKLLPS